jgi:hypothetical protein
MTGGPVKVLARGVWYAWVDTEANHVAPGSIGFEISSADYPEPPTVAAGQLLCQRGEIDEGERR